MSDWISVEDELPVEHADVWIFQEASEYATVGYFFDDRWFDERQTGPRGICIEPLGGSVLGLSFQPRLSGGPLQ